MAKDMFKHGALSWFELMTTDVDAAKSFYQNLFGWEFKKEPMPGAPSGTFYTTIMANGEQVAGMMNIPPDAEKVPPCWGIYVTVDDVDAVAQKVVELGGTILRPPMDIPGVGRFCVFQDPQGAVIQAMSYSMSDTSA